MQAFLAEHPNLETPFLLIDPDRVEAAFRRLTRALPGAQCLYSVKANPGRPILERLEGLGAGFDAASTHEIETCLAAGISPHRILYGNTVKKAADIAMAWGLGVRRFACDSGPELAKIARAAPESAVIARLRTAGTGAVWPLSSKFGCDARQLAALLVEAHHRGLGPLGISFHVGSEQSDPHAWLAPIRTIGHLLPEIERAGATIGLVDLGGGFPADYQGDRPPIEAYGDAIRAACRRYLPADLGLVMEPGRHLVAAAGVIQTEIVSIRQPDAGSRYAWVYIDAGVFNGLIETEAIVHPVMAMTPETGPRRQCVLAGPTCDNTDILGRGRPYELPAALAPGDRLLIALAGAYTSTLATVGFNGFPPLRTLYA
jgi:ornithine decarboxylase